MHHSAERRTVNRCPPGSGPEPDREPSRARSPRGLGLGSAGRWRGCLIGSTTSARYTRGLSVGWASSSAASSAAAGVACSVTLQLERARKLVGERQRSDATGDGGDGRARPLAPPSRRCSPCRAAGRASRARLGGGRAARVNRRAVRSSEEKICAQISSRLPSEPATARIAAALGSNTTSSSAAPAPRRARKSRRPGSSRGERAGGVGGGRSSRVAAEIAGGTRPPRLRRPASDACYSARMRGGGKRVAARWAQGARGGREQAKGLQRACSPCAVAEGRNRAATSYRRRRWRAAARCPAGAAPGPLPSCPRASERREPSSRVIVVVDGRCGQNERMIIIHERRAPLSVIWMCRKGGGL